MNLFKTIALLFFLFSVSVFAQLDSAKKVVNTDTAKEFPVAKREKSKMSKPATAALLSAVIPGLGQAYNQRYWKIPIVYAAIGGSAFMTYYNHREFRKFDFLYTKLRAPEKLEGNNAYKDVDTAAVVAQYGSYTESTIQYNATFHRDWRDKFIIITVLMYAANIIEAHVDAHLKDFNVSEDVSMRIRPGFTPTVRGFQSSLELNFYFRNHKKTLNENSFSGLW